MKEYHITDDVIIYNDMEMNWVMGKYQPRWHLKVYGMWMSMWKRVYSHINYFGSLIHPSFKYLSNYVSWIEFQPKFEEFCATCNIVRWNIDKDSKYSGNKNYYPEYMTLMTQSENSKEAITRNGSPMLKEEYARKRMKPVLGIPLDDTKKIVLTIARQDVSNYGFKPSHVGSCIRKKRKTHKGYKWYRVNYKHNKYRRVNGE